MARNFIFLLLFLTSLQTISQSLQNQVIGGAGQFTSQSNNSMVYALGEVSTDILNDGTNTLSQGFLQGATLSGIYWNGSVNTNWFNSANWDGGILPLSTNNVIITNLSNSPILETSESIIQNLELRANASLIIEKDGALTINNNLTNLGNLTINSDINTSGVLFVKGTSTSNVTYNRGGLLANKWSLLTTPLNNQKILEFAQNSSNEIRVNTSVTPNRYAIAYYNDSNAINSKWEYFDTNTNSTFIFDVGTGFSLSRNLDGNVSFSGDLTTTSVNKTVIANQWNAIGNSYTTYYPINKNGDNNFLEDNSTNIAIPAAYIWDNSQEKYTPITNLVTSPEQFVTPAQGFFIKSNASTALSFDSNKRNVKPSTGSHTFHKNSSEIPFIKLFAVEGEVKISADIIYSTTATKGFDSSEDIENFDGANFDVNTHLLENSEGKNFTIQSLPLSEIESLVVPISLKGQANNAFVFSLNTVDFPDAIKVYLEDRLLNSFVRLDEDNSEYKITLTENINGVGRFYLHTTSQSLSTLNLDPLEKTTIYKSNNKTLVIQGLKNEKAILKIFDILGKQVFDIKFNGMPKNNIKIPNLKSAVYLVELTTINGKKNKKIIID
jgi:hypothetical protein